MLIGTVSFATNEKVETIISNEESSIILLSDVKVDNNVEVVDYLVKDCSYRIVNSRGETVGGVILTGVPDDVPFGSKGAKAQALQIWQDAQ